MNRYFTSILPHQFSNDNIIVICDNAASSPNSSSCFDMTTTTTTTSSSSSSSFDRIPPLTKHSPTWKECPILSKLLLRQRQESQPRSDRHNNNRQPQQQRRRPTTMKKSSSMSRLLCCDAKIILPRGTSKSQEFFTDPVVRHMSCCPPRMPCRQTSR